MSSSSVTMIQLSPEELETMMERAAERGARAALADREEALPLEEAMRMLGASRTTMRRWEREGKLVPERVGRKVVYRRSTVMAAVHTLPAHGGRGRTQTLQE